MLDAKRLLDQFLGAPTQGLPQVQNRGGVPAQQPQSGGFGDIAGGLAGSLGNVLGVAGVSTGIAATLGALGFSPAVLAQVALMGAAGGAIGMLAYRYTHRSSADLLPVILTTAHFQVARLLGA